MQNRISLSIWSANGGVGWRGGTFDNETDISSHGTTFNATIKERSCITSKET
jgi:hypothetical protein